LLIHLYVIGPPSHNNTEQITYRPSTGSHVYWTQDLLQLSNYLPVQSQKPVKSHP